ncbi:MAG: helix-turn-helix domain-containing protein [bacterium]
MDSVTVRLKHRVSQAQLAYIMGVSSQTVSRWERGVVTPTLPQIRLMRMIHDTPKINLRTLDEYIAKSLPPLIVAPGLA